MRTFRSALLTIALIAAAHCAFAQDLQYTTVMHSYAPSLPSSMAAPSSTISVKGSQVRIDTHIEVPTVAGGTDMVMLLDMVSHKSYMLHPALKTYVEMPLPFTLTDSMKALANEMKARADSMRASMAAKMPQPKVVDLGETQQIAGFNARHMVMSLEPWAGLPAMPVSNLQPDMKMVFVMDGWFSTDSTLNRLHASIAKGLGSRMSDPLTKLLANHSPGGFPLRMTVIMLQVPDSVTPDPMAIIKSGEKAEHLFMRVTMDVTDIHTGTLDPALFSVPNDYKKDN